MLLQGITPCNHHWKEGHTQRSAKQIAGGHVCQVELGVQVEERRWKTNPWRKFPPRQCDEAVDPGARYWAQASSGCHEAHEKNPWKYRQQFQGLEEGVLQHGAVPAGLEACHGLQRVACRDFWHLDKEFIRLADGQSHLFWCTASISCQNTGEPQVEKYIHVQFLSMKPTSLDIPHNPLHLSTPPDIPHNPPHLSTSLDIPHNPPHLSTSLDIPHNPPHLSKLLDITRHHSTTPNNPHNIQHFLSQSVLNDSNIVQCFGSCIAPLSTSLSTTISVKQRHPQKRTFFPGVWLLYVILFPTKWPTIFIRLQRYYWWTSYYLWYLLIAAKFTITLRIIILSTVLPGCHPLPEVQRVDREHQGKDESSVQLRCSWTAWVSHDIWCQVGIPAWFCCRALESRTHHMESAMLQNMSIEPLNIVAHFTRNKITSMSTNPFNLPMNGL